MTDVAPRYRPMLASSGPIHGDAHQIAFEPKWDGWRALVSVRAGTVTVRTRTGRDVTDAIPELTGLGAVGDVVLDGELVANSGSPASFYRLGGRMAARRPVSVRHGARTTPLTFIAFDVLEFGDRDLTDEAYVDRRARLVDLALLGRAWATTPSFVGMGAEVFAACTALDLEGLVAKRLTSRYRCGERSPDWIKAKTASWRADHARFRGPSTDVAPAAAP